MSPVPNTIHPFRLRDNTWHENENKSPESGNETTNITLIPADLTFIRNPMLISVVISSIFQYLSFHDNKRLRSLCQEWNSVASLLLRKRATIVFKKDERRPVHFLRTLKLSTTHAPFTKFVFRDECTAKEIFNFISIYGKSVRSLTFDNLNVLFEQQPGQFIPSHIIKSSMWAQGNSLNELEINCRLGTKQYIAMEHLVNVKALKLENCGLFIIKNLKLSPSILSLNNVLFISYNTLHQCLINDVFDFQNAKEVYINQPKSNAKILDVGQDVAKIDRMSLYSVTVINWQNSQWDVDNLILVRMSLLDKITMRIKQLKIYNIGFDLRPHAFRHKIIDLPMLPATLQNLSVQNELKTDFICSHSINLPNLKTLQIVLSLIGKPLALPYFASCPNLTSISLRGYSKQQVVLDLSWLPQGIKKLELESSIEIIDNRINSKEPFRVNTLVLHPVAFADRASFLQKIHPQVIALLFDGWELEWEDIVSFVNKNNYVKNIFVRSISTLTTILERKDTFNLRNLAVQQTLFYVFENQMMKTITREVFDASINI